MPASPVSPVHPTALVAEGAKIHPSAEIGPYCIIGGGVSIGAGTRLLSHVVVDGKTSIGERNLIYPGTCIGFPAQAKPPLAGTWLKLGDDNVLREHVTLHSGSKEEGTVIGSRNLFMVGSHAGHDVHVADDVTLANSAALGGHVIVEEGAVIGGLVGVHQFVRIGKFSMVGAVTKPAQDVLPFSIIDGSPARLSGTNVIGLKRRGYSAKAIGDVRRALRLIRSSGGRFREVIESLRREFAGHAEIEHLIRFIEASKRGVIRRSAGPHGEEPVS